MSVRDPAAGIPLAAGYLLPFTLFIGATFPFAVRLVAEHADEAAEVSARVYAWNTVGSIVGATVAGFLFLPWLGLEGTMVLGVTSNLALAAGAALLVTPRAPALAGAAGVGLAALALVPHGPPWELLRNSVLNTAPFPGEFVYLGVGRSATVTLMRDGPNYRLASNGLPEAAIRTESAPPLVTSEVRWLAMLPVLARPEAESMLVVGLGGGNTVGGVPASVQRIDVIELEPEVVAANLRVPSRFDGLRLDDPRIRIRVADARGALNLSDARYDGIVSQPSHPWTSGASHLYTREFFALVRDHLTPGGVFCQWIGLGFIDEALLSTMLATLLEVFPHVELYRPSPDSILFAASEAPLDTLEHAERAIAAAPESFASEVIYRKEHVAAAMLLDTTGARALARGAPVNTDDDNRLATVAHGATGKFDWVEKVVRPHDPLPARIDELSLAPLILRLKERRQEARARSLVGKLTGVDAIAGNGFLRMSRRTGDGVRAALHAAAERYPEREDLRQGVILAERGDVRALELRRTNGASPRHSTLRGR